MLTRFARRVKAGEARGETARRRGPRDLACVTNRKVLPRSVVGNPSNIGSSWLTSDGEVINPDAPAGGGGAGRFRPAGSLGVDEPFNPTLPAPNAPAVRSLVTPDPSNASGVSVNPPPVTKTSTTTLKKQSDANNDIDVQVEVLADGVNTTEKAQAHTQLLPGTANPIFPAIHVDDATKKITKFNSKFILKGKATVQIRYKPGVDKAALSGYGRGTTAADQKAGDVSVGFHESCHVKDMLDWLKANALPVFTGKVGMTEKEFDTATADYGKAIDAYFESASQNSEKLTDEVGNPTRSQWLAANGP